MRLPKLKKKYLAIALASGVALGAGGIAAAYFGASGSGSGTATVTPPTNVWAIAGHVTGGVTGPGDPSVMTFTIGNNTTVRELASTLSVTVINKYTGTNHYTVITSTGPVKGCKWSWFHATLPAPPHLKSTKTVTEGTSAVVPRHKSVHIPVTLHMSNGTGPRGSTQDACAGTTPAVKLTVGR